MAQLQEALVRVRPPRVGEHTLLSFENMLESLESEDALSLELLADREGVSMFIRSLHPDRVVQQLLAHYPDIEVAFVEEDDDPARIKEGEVSWGQVLRPEGDDWLPLQVYDDVGLLEHSSDPFIDMVGGMRSDVQPGERVLSRLILKQKPHNWSESWREKALSGAGSENQQAVETERLTKQTDKVRKAMPSRGRDEGSGGDEGSGFVSDGVLLLIGGGLALTLMTLYFNKLWQQGDFLIVFGLAALAIVLICVGGVLLRVFGLAFWKNKNQFYDPQQVALRVGGAAFSMQIELMVVLNGRGNRSRARKLLEPVIAAYRSFDNPLGCRFDVSKMQGEGQITRTASFLQFRRVAGFSTDWLGGATVRVS